MEDLTPLNPVDTQKDKNSSKDLLKKNFLPHQEIVKHDRP
jgi:hypothetical protein